MEFTEHPSSFGIPKRGLNGKLAELKRVFEMLTALKLRFSLDPINVSLADKNYLTLDNDLIASWQRALVETLLITIRQRTDYIGSLLLLQHYLTLSGHKQPRY